MLHDPTRTDTPLSITNEQTGETYTYHRDHQGSITHLSNEYGEVIESFTYDAYGTIVEHIQEEHTFNPYCYTGREFDDKDFYYYRARYYDPSIGRFISSDPIEFLAGDFNFYRYVGGDPVNFVDPSGLKTWKEIKAGMSDPAAALGISGQPATVASQLGIMGSCPSDKKSIYPVKMGNMANALRHTTLSAIATERFGRQRSTNVLNAHESGSTDITDQLIFKDLPSADKAVDLRNNEIGRCLAEADSKFQDGLTVVGNVLDKAHSEGLWTAKKNKDGEYEIQKTKMSDENYKKYKRAMKYKDQNMNWVKDADRSIKNETNKK